MKCPKCDAPAILTKWLPSRGVESHLRQYKCAKCKYDFYDRTARKLKMEKESVK